MLPLCTFLLILIDLLSVVFDLIRCGDQGHQFGELFTKLVDTIVVNPEEIKGLGLLGETFPVKNESAKNDDTTT